MRPPNPTKRRFRPTDSRRPDRSVAIVSSLSVVAALTAMFGAAERIANACGVTQAGIQARSVWPSEDKTVPTNARLFVTYASSAEGLADLGSDLALLDGDGTAIPATVEVVEGSVLLKPHADLLPNHAYQLADRRTVPCAAAGTDACAPTNATTPFATITTGPGPDRTPPSFGGLAATSPQPDAICGGDTCCGHVVPIKFDWTNGTDDVAGVDVRYDVFEQDGAMLVPVARLLPLDGFHGAQVCDGSWGGPDIGPGNYVVRAVDYAGNEDQNLIAHGFSDQCFTDSLIPACEVAGAPPVSGAPILLGAAVFAFGGGLLACARRRPRNARASW
jgi:hypothetical protein